MEIFSQELQRTGRVERRKGGIGHGSFPLRDTCASSTAQSCRIREREMIMLETKLRVQGAR